MEKLIKINNKISNKDAWEVANLRKIAETIKAKIAGHEFYARGYDNHPHSVLRPLVKGDDELICGRIASQLYDIAERDWSNICIVRMIDTSDLTRYADWYREYLSREYVLKPEYVDMVKNACDEFIEKLNAREIECAEMEAKEAARKQAIKDRIVSCETKSVWGRDEGGRVERFVHTITTKSGDVLKFSECNVFDFGVVINPKYPVVEGAKEGGIARMDRDGITYWIDFDTKGWYNVRPLTKSELDALMYIHTFGGCANSGVRM